MTFGQSELVTGLGLSLVVAIAGLVVLALWWRRAVSLRANTSMLSDGVVLIVEDGTVIEVSAQTEALLGLTIGRQARTILSEFLGSRSDAALAALERSGDAIHLLTTDAAGRVFELTGTARGGHIRLVLRDAGLLDAERNRASVEIAARDQADSQREIENRTLSGLLADAPLAAWRRTPDGHLAWSGGQISTSHGIVTAAEAATMAAAVNRASAEIQGEQPARAGSDGAPGPVERFRLEIAGAAEGTTITLDAIETTDADGARLGLAIDASGAQSVEQSLARFVQTMTETFAHLNIGLAIFDRSQTLALFNPALVRLWQADPAWLARRPSLREIIDSLRANRRIPEMPDFHAWRRQLNNLFENTETADYEELWHLADGSDIHVLARPHPHGSLAFVFEDVTDRLRLEQQFRHSIELRRATLDRLDEGLAVFGPDGLLQLVNAAFHEIWGTDAKTVRPLMHASELLPLVRGLTVETDVWQELTTYITGGDSRQAWSARLTLGTGRILGARFASLPDGSTMAVFGDVTDSERIATALRERNEALEAAEEMRSAVMGHISHRLRTPLNTIFGFGQLIADSRFGGLTDAQRGYANAILESARHLLATIDDVTELAGLEIDPLHDQELGLSLSNTLLLTARLLEKRATEEGVALRIISPPSGCEPACDAGRLRQIVFNMTTDAINRCSDGSTIDLGARVSPDGGIEIYTLEACGDGLAADPARAEAASLNLPFLHRLVAREGGSFELRSVAGAEPGETSLSAVCHLRRLAALAESANPEPANPAAAG
ncbi:MAG TPA: PAS-domain containing protein [Thermohalobaculum sp.]|nr:PAS-domain containing protein [Thermohalobaculum sp.]